MINVANKCPTKSSIDLLFRIISYHQQILSLPDRKTQVFPQKRGFRFAEGNRPVVDLLLAAGTKATLRAAHAAEQGTAPKQAAELAKEISRATRESWDMELGEISSNSPRTILRTTPKDE